MHGVAQFALTQSTMAVWSRRPVAGRSPVSYAKPGKTGASPLRGTSAEDVPIGEGVAVHAEAANAAAARVNAKAWGRVDVLM